MSVRHWIVAGLFGLACISSAVAAEADGRDVVAGSHGSTDNTSHESGSGDLLGYAHDSTPSRHSSDNDSGGDSSSHAGSAGGGGDRGSHGSAPVSARPAPLGWQSLLPGSIQ